MKAADLTKTNKWAFNFLVDNNRIVDVVFGQLDYYRKLKDESENIIDVYFSNILYGYSEYEDTGGIINRKYKNKPETNEESYWSIDKNFMYLTREDAFKGFLSYLFEGKNSES